MITEYEQNGHAMGTEFSIAIVCDSQERTQTLSQYAEETIRMYETRFSRFLPRERAFTAQHTKISNRIRYFF
jgi:hypothetical protein